MIATIVNYKRGRKTQTTNQMIIVVKDVSSKEDALKLVGKKVEYKCDGKQNKTINGVIKNFHGNNGAMRVLFEKGMPGQAIGQTLEVLK